MKVTYGMMNRQLRFRGFLSNQFFKPSSEEKFITMMKGMQKVSNMLKGKLKINGIEMTETWLTREDGSKLRICIYKPRHLSKEKKVPGVLWLHGGGYALGIPEYFSLIYKKLIEARDCVIVAPDYRLSIDQPYPDALVDAYASLLWMKDYAEELGIRTDQLMVGGNSAGGGLTAALTLLARNREDVNVAYQMPLYPMIDDRMQTESVKGNNAPMWDSNKNRWAWKLYLGDLYGQQVPAYAAAARATDYSHLPPTLTFVGDIDPFRDETIQYVQQLRDAGVPVDFKLFKGAYHGFEVVKPEAKISQEALFFFLHSFAYAVDHYFAPQNE